MSAITTTLITGGSRGIGLEIARLLASRGHRLLLVSRDSVRLNSAAQELRQAYGAEVHSHAIDLSEPGILIRIISIACYSSTSLQLRSFVKSMVH
ncbi:MAG: SDR family NAD(P)-dependent oxidoreductase [Betaproteobacteria bacterium]|nr:SDR family NAD(P)-dependent oxidoreductase [Betaproteobacteria bacterium]